MGAPRLILRSGPPAVDRALARDLADEGILAKSSVGAMRDWVRTVGVREALRRAATALGVERMTRDASRFVKAAVGERVPRPYRTMVLKSGRQGDLFAGKGPDTRNPWQKQFDEKDAQLRDPKGLPPGSRVGNGTVSGRIPPHGEGARGGRVIGHTRSGKPVYLSPGTHEHVHQHVIDAHRAFDYVDHEDAAKLHEQLGKQPRHGEPGTRAYMRGVHNQHAHYHRTQATYGRDNEASKEMNRAREARLAGKGGRSDVYNPDPDDVPENRRPWDLEAKRDTSNPREGEKDPYAEYARARRNVANAWKD